MAEYTNLSALFGDIADSIRDKTGGDEPIKAEAFPEAIEGIQTIAGSETSAAKIITREITEYMDDNGYINSIASSAFIGCSDLADASFPECDFVGMWAFAYCTNLSRITIGKAETLDNYAFRDCENLTQIWLPGSTVATIGQYTFSSTPVSTSSFTKSFASVYVPASLVEAYQNAAHWSTYKSRITAIPEDDSEKN